MGVRWWYDNLSRSVGVMGERGGVTRWLEESWKHGRAGRMKNAHTLAPLYLVYCVVFLRWGDVG